MSSRKNQLGPGVHCCSPIKGTRGAHPGKCLILGVSKILKIAFLAHDEDLHFVDIGLSTKCKSSSCAKNAIFRMKYIYIYK